METKKIYTLFGNNVLEQKEDFEKLGFELIELPERENIVMGYLPKNWYKVVTTGSSPDENVMKVYDEYGNLRCITRRQTVDHRITAHTELKRRYDVHEYQHGNLYENVTFYFGEEPINITTPGKQLFTAGTAHDGIEFQRTCDESIKFGQDCEKYAQECETYGDQNYPGWRDYDAYWDKKELVNDKPKVIKKEKTSK